MRNMRGKVLDGNNVLAENVDVTESTTPSGLRGWQGSFELPPDVKKPTYILLVEAGMRFKLILDDGRSGEITVRQVTTHSNGKIESKFVVDGPLK